MTRNHIASDWWQAGLWRNNPALVQVLGLCPLLAVSNTAVNALALGLATLLVMTASNVAVSLCRRWIPGVIRLPVFVLLIGSLVSCVEMLIHAWTYSLYQTLGIFIPLIVSNCVIISRAERFAAQQPVHLALADGLAHGVGFAAVLFVLGSIRELVGSGHWLQGAEQLLGPVGAQLSVAVAELRNPPLLMLLPPGAFLTLAGLIALKNAIDLRRQRRQAAVAAADLPLPAAPSNTESHSLNRPSGDTLLADNP